MLSSVNLNGTMSSLPCSPVFVDLPNTPIPSSFNCVPGVRNTDDSHGNVYPYSSPIALRTPICGTRRPNSRRLSTVSTDRRRTLISQTSSTQSTTPPPSRSSSQFSDGRLEVDDEYVHSLYARRKELQSAVERLGVELLQLLYDEWTLTGTVPEEMDKIEDGLCIPNQRLKSTSYPLRHFMVNRANTFSHPRPPKPKQTGLPELNKPVTRFSEWPMRYRRVTRPSPSLSIDNGEEMTDFSQDLSVPASIDGLRARASPSQSDAFHASNAIPLAPVSICNNQPISTCESSNSVPDQIAPVTAVTAASDLQLDESVVERAVMELKLRRLEVDYAVVSHLRDIHKQKASETKRDAYKIAYKTNSKKLKEIVNEMSSLKLQLSNCTTNEMFTTSRPDKHCSLTSLVRHSRSPSVDHQPATSLPATPLKRNFVDQCINHSRKTTGRPIQLKHSRRPSLIPFFKMLNSTRRSIRSLSKCGESINLGRDSSASLVNARRPSPSPHNRLNGMPSSLRPVTRLLPEGKTGDIAQPVNFASNTTNIQSTDLVDPQRSARLSRRTQRTSVHVFARSHSLPDWQQRTSILHGSVSHHSKPPATKSATEFKCPSGLSPLSRNAGYSLVRGTHYFPKRTIATASTTSSSNWSTSGCSCLSSNTADSLSPVYAHHLPKLGRTVSSPTLESPVSSDSSCCSASAIDCLKNAPTISQPPNTPHNGVSDYCTKLEPLAEKLAARLYIDDADEGYGHYSDIDFFATQSTVSRPVPQNSCDTTLVQAQSPHRPAADFKLSEGNTPTCRKRASLRPLTLIRRAVSRMSSRGPNTRRPPSINTLLKTKIRSHTMRIPR